MASASNLQATATRLLTSFGQSAAFVRTIQGTYNTSIGATNPAIITSFSGYCVPMNYNARDIAGTDILLSDVKLYVNLTSRPPLVGDDVTVGAKSYRVMNVSQIVFAGSDIIYELQVRL